MSFSSVMTGLSPAAWYRLGEASGTTMTDSSGNSRNGAYSGSPWTNPTLGSTGLLHDGDTDTAATFNGTTSEAEVTYNSGWMNNTTFSAFARIKPNTTTGNHSVVGRYVTAGGNVNAWVIRQDGTTLYLWYNNGSNYFSLTLGTVASGTEYSAGVTVGSGVVKVYFNGSLADSRTDTIRSTTANLLIGANYQGSPNEVFSGVIDEVAYWNGTLTGTDMSNLHTAATTAAGATVAAVAATATASTAAPTVSATSTVTPPAATATGSAAAPVVTGTGDGTVLAVAATATASATAPSVATDSTLSAVAATATASAAAPALSWSASVDAVAATATAGAVAPVVFDGSGNRTVFAVPATATAAAHAPVFTQTVAFDTDTSNALDGLDLTFSATVTVTRPAATVPATLTLADRYDKALPYPVPTMVNGRPT